MSGPSGITLLESYEIDDVELDIENELMDISPSGSHLMLDSSNPPRGKPRVRKWSDSPAEEVDMELASVGNNHEASTAPEGTVSLGSLRSFQEDPGGSLAKRVMQHRFMSKVMSGANNPRSPSDEGISKGIATDNGPMHNAEYPGPLGHREVEIVISSPPESHLQSRAETEEAATSSDDSLQKQLVNKIVPLELSVFHSSSFERAGSVGAIAENPFGGFVRDTSSPLIPNPTTRAASGPPTPLLHTQSNTRSGQQVGQKVQEVLELLNFEGARVIGRNNRICKLTVDFLFREQCTEFSDNESELHEPLADGPAMSQKQRLGKSRSGLFFGMSRSTKNLSLVHQPYVLEMTIQQARNLPKKLGSGRCDPFVVVTVNGVSSRTRTKHNTYEASWEQTMSFNVEGSDTNIHVAVWDWENGNRQTVIGSASLTVGQLLKVALDDEDSICRQAKSRRTLGGQLKFPLRQLFDQKTLRQWSGGSIIGGQDSRDKGVELGSSLIQRASSTQEEEADPSSSSMQTTRIVVVISTGWIVLLAMTDFVAAVWLHLLWGLNDILCSENPQAQETNRPNWQIVCLLAVILFFHLLDITERILRRDALGDMTGLRYYFKEPGLSRRRIAFNVWDTLIVLLSVAIVCFGTLECSELSLSEWQHEVITRLHIIVHSARCLNIFMKCLDMQNHWRKQLQTIISGNKRRYIDVERKVDLDLTYILDRLIAMAVPVVEGAVYRNDIREVSRFLANAHYGRFLVFNLCEWHEESGNGNYDVSLLYDHVIKIPFFDHNSPLLNMLLAYCEFATEWLNQDKRNVVVVHCRGGKGRTGTFCSALELWTGVCGKASEALDLFAFRRTDLRRGGGAMQGVAAPCQKRYVRYLDKIIHQKDFNFTSKRAILSQIQMFTMPGAAKQDKFISFIVTCGNNIEYDYGKSKGFFSCSALPHNEESESPVWNFNVGSVLLDGDVSIRFFLFDRDRPGGSQQAAELGPGGTRLNYGSLSGKQLFWVSFHTAFTTGVVSYEKSEIDGAYNKKPKLFADNFSVRVHINSGANPVEPCRSNSSTVGGKNTLKSGTALSIRYLQLRDKLKAIATTVCPSPTVFGRGDVIHSTRSLDHDKKGKVVRKLFIVESGMVALKLSGLEDVDFLSRWRGISTGSRFGAGDVFGEVEFLLGPQTDGPAAEYVAETDQVEVRVLCVEASEDMELCPLQFGDLDPLDTSHIMETVAMELIIRCRSFFDKSAELHKQLSIVKHDTGTNVGTAHKQRLTKRLVSDFHLPVTTQLFSMGKAGYLHSDRQFSCNLCVFSEVFIFYSNAKVDGKPLRRSIPIKAVKNIECDDRKLALFVDSRAAAQQTGEDESPNRNNFSQRSPSRAPVLSRRSSQVKHGSVSSLYDVNTNRRSSDDSTANLMARYEFVFDNMARRSEIAQAVQERIVAVASAQKMTKEWVYDQRKSVSEHAELIGGDAAAEDAFHLGSKFGYMDSSEQNDELAAQAMEYLFLHSQTTTYKDGEVILPIGNTERRLFHILEGDVLCQSVTGQVLVRLGQGEIFGKTSYLETGNRGSRTDVVARGDVMCLELKGDMMDMLASLKPEVGMRLYRSLATSSARRLRDQLTAVLSQAK